MPVVPPHLPTRPCTNTFACLYHFILFLAFSSRSFALLRLLLPFDNSYPDIFLVLLPTLCTYYRLRCTPLRLLISTLIFIFICSDAPLPYTVSFPLPCYTFLCLVPFPTCCAPMALYLSHIL
jgi:hypothetical protein